MSDVSDLVFKNPAELISFKTALYVPPLCGR